MLQIAQFVASLFHPTIVPVLIHPVPVPGLKAKKLLRRFSPTASRDTRAAAAHSEIADEIYDKRRVSCSRPFTAA